MANETRTVLVVLIVCGFLMCGCIGLPVGVGALLFYQAAEQRDIAQARAKAVIAEQEAKMQAELAKMPVPVPPPAQASPPPVLPPSGIAAPGLGAPDLNDVEQRKVLYQLLKLLRIPDAQFKELGTDDPALAQAAATMKSQQEAVLQEICKNYGITRARLDEIMAEGDKAGW